MSTLVLALTGSADETARIQTALDASGSVLLQPGTWPVTTLTYGDGTMLAGAGRGKTILRQIAGTADYLLKPAAYGIDKVVIADLMCNGFLSQSTSLGGVLLEGVSNSELRSVGVEGFATVGIWVKGHGTAVSGDAMYNVLLNPYVINMKTGAACIRISPASGGGSHPDRTRILGGYLGGQDPNTGILVDPPSVDAVGALGADNLVVIGLTGQNLTAPFDVVAQSAKFIGCSFENTSAAADVYVRAGTTNFPSRDNYFNCTYPSQAITFHDSGLRTTRDHELDSSGATTTLETLFSGDYTLRLREDGDTADRLRVRSDGRLEWGDGTTVGLSKLYPVPGLPTVLRGETELNSLHGAATDIAFSSNIAFEATQRLRVLSDGKFEWSNGTDAVDAFLYRAAVAALRTDGLLTADHIGIIDGVTAPAAIVGQALIYVDGADGDLKVRFGDGTTKTIVVDT